MNTLPPRNHPSHASESLWATRTPILAKCFWLKPLLILLCIMSPLSADQFGDFTYTNNGTHVTITGYTGSGGAVVIPSTIVALPVTVIGNNSFQSKSSITSVVIPSTVTSIQDLAFSYITGFSSITIPSSVSSLGYGVFIGCTSLASIVVDAANSVYSSNDGVLFNKTQATLIQYPGGKGSVYSVPSGVTTVSQNAFAGPSGIANITIPASVNTIQGGAFSRSYALSSITVNTANPSYSATGGVLFNKSQSILIHYPAAKNGAYTIPSSVTTIWPYALEYCVGLTAVTIPASVRTIEYGAFFHCSALTSVSIPASVTTIGNSVFRECSSLTAITVDAGNPNYSSLGGVLFNKLQTTLMQYPGEKNGGYSIPTGVTTVGEDAFIGCDGLTSVVIPSGVTTIGGQAFHGTSLSSITFPASITSLGSSAFSYCYYLSSATFLGNAPSLGSSVFQSPASGFKIYFYSGASGFTTPTWQGYPSEMLTGGGGGTLADAVDAPLLTFTTGGSASWASQTSVTHDSIDAAASGDISNNQESWMETTVTGPGTISFWWSTASDFNDFLGFYVDGVLQSGPISGNTSWQQKMYVLGAGTHNLRWRYAKDFFGEMFSDTAWVDEVVWTPSGSSLAEIAVEEFFNPLTSGVSSVNYGSVVTTGTPAVRGFNIRNTGSENLTSVFVTITGTDAGDFSIQFQPDTVITPGKSTSFGLSFRPLGTGARTATLRIASNDADENPFLINLLGMGVTNSPPVANAAGPYSLGIGFDFVPSGALTSDPNSPNDILSYAWDLDNDGQFDDAVGVQPVVPWSFFSAMPRPGPSSIQLRVTDQSGAISTASSQVSIVPLPLPHYEIFTGTTDAFDLAFKSLEFIPNGSGGYSFSGAVTIATLPSDPSGHALLASITDADDATQSVSLTSGAVIPFYGVNRSQFWVSSNGVINFTTSSVALTENAATHVGSTQVAVFWDDLHAGTAGDIRFAQLVDRAVITWFDVAQFGTAATRVTAQAELFFDGRIRLSYGNVGIQDGLVGISPGLPGNFIAETDISEVSGSESPFALWAGLGGLIDDKALPGAIPYHDGVPNLLKFAFGLNPSGPDARRMVPGGTVGLPSSYLHQHGGTVWRVEYLRRKNSGLTYTPRKSTTLGSGSFAPLTGTPMVSEIVGFPDWQRVIIEEPFDPATTPKLFTTVEVVGQ